MCVYMYIFLVLLKTSKQFARRLYLNMRQRQMHYIRNSLLHLG